MIRFPVRFHASNTPGAVGIEPNYRETERAKVLTQPSYGKTPRDPRYDFKALEKAYGK